MTAYSTTSSEAEGLETVELRAPGQEGLRAAFAPGANLVLHSLKKGDHELLAVNDGLRAYRELGSTMGVPLLFPWANRLSRSTYVVDGTEVSLPRDVPLFARDHNGLPIHGALPGLMHWDVVEATADEDNACLRARLEWDPAHEAFGLFPFSHRLGYEALLTEASIEITVTVAPTGNGSLPVSFGFHPYLRIPGGPRADARMTLPVRRQLVHDDSMIPTGASEPFSPGTRSLGDSSWDDGFSGLVSPQRFLLTGREQELSLAFGRGYGFAQVYAPPDSDFVCFEPMTAPTNALVRGGPDLSIVAPGQSYAATFEISIPSLS
jgi:aldose 1-epimerase